MGVAIGAVRYNRPARAVGYIGVSKVGGKEGKSYVSPQLRRERIEAVARREGLEVADTRTRGACVDVAVAPRVPPRLRSSWQAGEGASPMRRARRSDTVGWSSGGGRRRHALARVANTVVASSTREASCCKRLLSAARSLREPRRGAIE